MKIRSVTATPVNIPLRAPYRFSYGSTASLTKTVIEVLTDDGIVGLGECADGDRAAIGGRELRIDANGGYTLPTARLALRAFSPFEISWFEEPCEDYEDMAALRAHTDISFSSHRIDLRKAVALRCPDAIVTNLNELGGIAATVAFIKAAEAFNVGFRFHSGETGIGSAAYLQVSAAVEAVRGASQTLLRWYGDDVIEGGPMVPKGGKLGLPEGAGLGVTLDRKALARCHQRYLDEGAFPSGVAGLGYGGRFRKG